MAGAKRSGRSRTRQVAALPWKMDERLGLRILMITSRETRRWVVPKGGRMSGKTDAEAAATEAIEEAGILGDVLAEPIGVFRYLKVLGLGEDRAYVVSVFPLQVTIELENWMEAHERTRMWMSADEAARAVHEPDLAALILAFAASMTGSGRA